MRFSKFFVLLILIFYGSLVLANTYSNDRLFIAISEGLTDEVEQLLKEENIDLFFEEQYEMHNRDYFKLGYHPLVTAAEEGYEKIVELLLRKNINPDIRSKPHTPTALIAAVRRGHYAIVEMLLQKGADPNFYPDDFNRCAIHFIPTENDRVTPRGLEILKLLMQNGADLYITPRYELLDEEMKTVAKKQYEAVLRAVKGD